MKLRINKACVVEGKSIKADAIVEVDKSVARYLIGAGLAVVVADADKKVGTGGTGGSQ